MWRKKMSVPRKKKWKHAKMFKSFFFSLQILAKQFWQTELSLAVSIIRLETCVDSVFFLGKVFALDTWNKEQNISLTIYSALKPFFKTSDDIKPSVCIRLFGIVDGGKMGQKEEKISALSNGCHNESKLLCFFVCTIQWALNTDCNMTWLSCRKCNSTSEKPNNWC